MQEVPVAKDNPFNRLTGHGNLQYSIYKINIVSYSKT